MGYRQKFRKDVIIDYICFRKYGHNELDDPSFTQPLMYSTIRNRKSIPDMYADQLVVSQLFYSTFCFKLFYIDCEKVFTT